jgi:acyl-CoA thioesterase FadM
VYTETTSIAHRPERNGSVPDFDHVPYFLAVEVAADAWRAALEDRCPELIATAAIAAVHVSADFSAELFTGETIVQSRVARIGRSSFTMVVDIVQNGVHGASIATTLAKVDPNRTRSIALTAAERSSLEGV